MALVSPAGGLIYHGRALRHRNGLWAPFRTQLARWLEHWIPKPSGRLVLVGPSAGHTLPWQWLGKFDELFIVEPDPLARAWLAMRARRAGTALHFIQGESWLTGSATDLTAMTTQMQKLHCPPLLFTNVLGQLALLRETFHDDKPWRRAFNDAIAPLPWASFHDRGSCHDIVIQTPQPPPWQIQTQSELSLVDAAHALGWLPPLEVEDHGTGGLLPPGPRGYALWPITPDSSHLIEWTHAKLIW